MWQRPPRELKLSEQRVYSKLSDNGLMVLILSTYVGFFSTLAILILPIYKIYSF